MRSILVVVTRQIGDVLLTTPLIRRARQAWPQARIDVLGFAGTLGMLHGNPDIDGVIESQPRPGWRGSVRLLRRIARRYELALVADPGDRAHILGWLAAPVRTGIVPPESDSNWWKRRLLTHAVTSAGDLGEVHVVQEKVRLLSPWTAGDQDVPPLVPPAPQALPDALQSRLGAGYLVMHVPSMWPYKQWPLASFRALAAFLVAAGRQVVLTGGPGAHDRACVAEVLDAADAQLLLDAGTLGFGQLAALLRGATLYIGPDTSISHLAAACGTPVLAIFGPTNPQRWAPWPAGTAPVRFARRSPAQAVGNVTLMQSSLPCVPCGRAGCEDHRQSPSECLPGIEPGRVAAKVLDLLGSLRDPNLRAGPSGV